MNTTYPVAVMLALGIVASMWALSGMGAVYSQGSPQLEGVDNIQEEANDSAAHGIGGSASNADDGDIVGLILSALPNIVNLAGLVTMAPSWLASIGFPYWFARPIGWLFNIIVGVGVTQWAANRYWQ